MCVGLHTVVVIKGQCLHSNAGRPLDSKLRGLQNTPLCFVFFSSLELVNRVATGEEGDGQVLGLLGSWVKQWFGCLRPRRQHSACESPQSRKYIIEKMKERQSNKLPSKHWVTLGECGSA